ncbi:MAG: signal transduction protein, partial [Persephonella sp.]
MTEVGDVVDNMVAAKVSSVVVVDDDMKPVGIFTERDITRRVVFKADPS